MKHLDHIINLAYGGLERTTTPDAVAEELVKKGLAKHGVGGLMATDMAHHLLLSKGHKPPSWR